MYNEFLRSKMARQLAAGGKQTMVLPAITNLKKLCNHPSLIVDSSTGRPCDGFESGVHHLPAECMPGPSNRNPTFRPELSGKFHVLHQILRQVRLKGIHSNRAVLVSDQP